ncbi:MAG: hypothetical protein M5R36_04360 [Deltaproteobacteria bacterium]|nr:hypothetical protein [Deltaproteobacteria bacterium]
MPGRVLDQIEVKPEGSSWEYPFHPRQFGVQHSNFDVRDFATGEWELADTVVMQFFLEADGPNGKVF